MDWILPANPKLYKHNYVFDKYGFIDWAQKSNFSVGDTVYIYTTRPIQAITHKTLVTRSNMEYSEVFDDSFFWTNIEDFIKNKQYKFVKLELVEIYGEELFTLNKLLENGLTGTPQRGLRVNKRLKEYLDNINSQLPNYADEEQTFIEGKTRVVKVNKYERNPKARDECVKHFGFQCQVCGFDFAKKYGTLGSKFIHVHHLIPISEIKDSYEVNPIKDLIPVCPNCHAMLHRKNNKGDYYSVEELKSIIIGNK